MLSLGEYQPRGWQLQTLLWAVPGQVGCLEVPQENQEGVLPLLPQLLGAAV